MKMRNLVVAVLLVSVASLAAFAVDGVFQFGELDASGVRMVYTPTNPYLYRRADIDRVKVFEEYFRVTTVKGTKLTMDDLEFLDVYPSDADLAGLWEQMHRYGDITDWWTMSRIRIKDIATSSDRTSWCISEGEALLLRLVVDLDDGRMGEWPWSYR